MYDSVKNGMILRIAVISAMVLGLGSINVNAGLHTHWKFDETEGTVAVDSSGNGNEGTFELKDGPSVEPTRTTGGEDGGSFVRFDGGKYVKRDVSGITQFSISMWAKRDSTSGSSLGLFTGGAHDGTNHSSFQIDINTNRYRWVGTNSGFFGAISSDWVHLVGTCDGTTINLYYNGKKTKSFAAGALDKAINQLAVGVNRGMSASFGGDIDEFRFYDHTLSATEVVDLYHSYKPLIAHWQFNETKDATEVVDSSTFGYNANVTGGTFSGLHHLTFNGSSDFVEAQSFTGISGDNSRTVMAWIKTTVLEVPIVAWGANRSNEKFVFRVSKDGDVRVEISGSYYEGKGAKINSDEWVHVAVVWSQPVDGTGIGVPRLFIDGIYQENFETNTNPFYVNTATDSKVRVGKDFSGNFFNGDIRDVRIYGVALNDSDVTAVYNDELTPVIGLDTVLENGVLSWSAETEVGVKEYQLVDADTGEILVAVEAGAGSYSVEIPGGVSKVNLVVVDHSGYQQTFLAEDSVGTVVLELKEDWNLISVPFECNFDMDVWTWNSAAQTYVITDRLEQGQGGWIFSTAAETLTLAGETVEGAMAVDAGWNLVGPTDNHFAPEGVLIYGWDKAYLQTDVMTVGSGYWIYTEEAALINLK